MAKWVVANKKCDFKLIGEELGIDQVVVRVMRNRGLENASEMRNFIKGDISQLHSYDLLKDIDKAVDTILDKIDEGMPIRIIGDYDVDGIMSTYILYKGLSFCGANVDYVIPHRIKDGYGINEQLIDEANESGVDTIITCDNGIAAKDAWKYANSLGMTCVVTDHHEIPFEIEGDEKKYILPDVAAIVDPKQEDCYYPFKNICGAVVAYKFIEAMIDAIGEERDILSELLEMAGMATVCDVMELIDENRAIVKYALKSLEHSRNIGLRALIKVCDLEGKAITSHSIGFVLGPCINATGRLDSATLSMELLCVDNIEDGIVIATKLKELNESRKTLTEKGVEQAINEIETTGKQNKKVIVVLLKELHESLAGIVAGRVREKYGKPSFVVTASESGLKGSARSIHSYHMYDAMNEISDVFTKFGGHAMAAGFSLEEERFEEFENRINDTCKLTEEDYIEKITIDVPMPVSYVTERLVEQLSILEPFGTGNEKPVFAQKDAMFTAMKIMGKNGNMARFNIVVDGRNYVACLFRRLDEFLNLLEEKYGKNAVEALKAGQANEKMLMDVIYYPSINEFNGRRNLQFIINDFK